jgi:long-chain acyl-CoA synthetase
VVRIVENDEISAAGRQFTRTLDALGIPKRATVAALLANTAEFLAVYRGVTHSGRRLTNLSNRWSPPDVSYVMENSGSTAFVADQRFSELAAAASSAIPKAARFAVGGPIADFRPWSEILEYPADPLPDALAGDVLLYTSGTSGRPKGVWRELPQAGPPPTLIGNAGQQMMQAFLSAEGRKGPHLVCCPLYHVGPLTYCDGALLLGSSVVLMEHFDPEEFLALIEKHRVTSTFMVPTQFVRLLRLPEATREKFDLSSLELVVHGAAPVAIEIKRRMIEWFGPILLEAYGGTEGGGVLINSRDWLEHPGSVGKPRPGLEVVILDEEGEPCPAGTEGTIYFRDGPQAFRYKDDPEKTAEATRGDLFTLGDVGRLDAEGYLYLLDRRADIIISGGVNIYPAQIESVLLELEEVADCCVIGAPNDEWGEEVRAVVELAGEASPTGATAKKLIGHCREHLGGFQIPRRVDFSPSLPRTETGKLARREIRKTYWKDRERRI